MSQQADIITVTAPASSAIVIDSPHSQSSTETQPWRRTLVSSFLPKPSPLLQLITALREARAPPYTTMPYEVFARLYIHIDEHFSKAAIQVSLARPETYARFYLLVDSDDGTRQCRMLEFPPSATVHASPEAPSIGFVTEGNLSRIWDVCTDMLRPGEIPKTWLDRVSVQLKIRGIVN